MHGRAPLIVGSRRRPALIATALSVPIVVILAFALANHSSGTNASTADPTAFVSVNAPTPSPESIEPCAQLLSQLPVQLDGLNPRKVAPYPDDGAPIVAWGNPPVVLQCGVTRPAELVAASSALIVGVDKVDWLPVADSSKTVFTAVDRAVYVRVTVPKSLPQPPLATISTAITAALPKVCHVPAEEPSASPPPPAGEASTVGPLCTQRPS